MTADGSIKQNLTLGSGRSYSPEWSSDGSKIVFYSNRVDGTTLEIYVMNADGTNVKAITTPDGTSDNGAAPVWWGFTP